MRYQSICYLQSSSKCYILAFMNLHDYLSSPGALTVAQLRERIGAPSSAQIRQWQHGYAGRKPSFENCVAIESATAGAVTVEEIRPVGFWMRIADPAWPHPLGRPVLDFAAGQTEVAKAEG